MKDCPFPKGKCLTCQPDPRDAEIERLTRERDEAVAFREHCQQLCNKHKVEHLHWRTERDAAIRERDEAVAVRQETARRWNAREKEISAQVLNYAKRARDDRQRADAAEADAKLWRSRQGIHAEKQRQWKELEAQRDEALETVGANTLTLHIANERIDALEAQLAAARAAVDHHLCCPCRVCVALDRFNAGRGPRPA